MCDFCHKHGEGQKWYLRARNYSDDLLNDLRRRRCIKEFFNADPKDLARQVQELERLSRAPKLIRRLLTRLITRRMKRDHFGQVLPLEDVERIFGFTNCIVRLACICRRATTNKEKRYCYGVTLAPDGGQLGRLIGGLGPSAGAGPDAAGLERLTREQALAAFREHEREGLCHTVWTFRAPFIGGICNCDRSDCLALRCTVTHQVPVMFRAEYVARVVPDDCVGCRACMRVCQFGAVSYSAAEQKAVIDQRWCYGCGICRAVCQKNAIRLDARASVLAAAAL